MWNNKLLYNKALHSIFNLEHTFVPVVCALGVRESRRSQAGLVREPRCGLGATQGHSVVLPNYRGEIREQITKRIFNEEDFLPVSAETKRIFCLSARKTGA